MIQTAQKIHNEQLDQKINQAISNLKGHLNQLNDKNTTYFNELQNHKFNNPKGPTPKINVQFDNRKMIKSNYQENYQNNNNQQLKDNNKQKKQQNSKIQGTQKYPNQFITTSESKHKQGDAPQAPVIIKKDDVRSHIPFTSVSNNKMNYLDWGAQATERQIPPNEYPVLNGLKSNTKTSYRQQFPKNQQTIDLKIIKMIKDQQKGIHKFIFVIQIIKSRWPILKGNNKLKLFLIIEWS